MRDGINSSHRKKCLSTIKLQAVILVTDEMYCDVLDVHATNKMSSSSDDWVY
jgi:hypothetical protein